MEEESYVLAFTFPAHKKDDDDDGASSYKSSDKSTIRSHISIRSSDKSTIRSDGSIESDNNGSSDIKKRKLEFGEEEDSDEEYDSSDDKTTTPIKKEEEKEDIVTSNDFLDEYGLDDEDIIEMMDADYRLQPDQKQNLLPNLRYLKSVYDSEVLLLFRSLCFIFFVNSFLCYQYD